VDMHDLIKFEDNKIGSLTIFDTPCTICQSILWYIAKVCLARARATLISTSASDCVARPS
jgi:hypothetical protein